MIYDKEFCDRLSDLAGALTPIREIAILLDVPEDALRMAICDRSSAVSHAYYKAKAETALQMRRQELELARVGSPLAAQLTATYLQTMDADEDL